MEIGDLYPYWAREWDAFVTGLREIADKEREARPPEEFERIWDWMPPGGRRSINDTLRHIAYAVHSIIDKLILDRAPKATLPATLFPPAQYPTFSPYPPRLPDIHAPTN